MTEMSRREGLKALMAAVASLAAPHAVRSAEPEIVIGNPNALTGFLGEDGLRGTWGLLLAADAVNRHGGIKSLGGATQGASVSRRLIAADHAVMLFGGEASAITLAAQSKRRSRRFR
jgi:hypothetical protein